MNELAWVTVAAAAAGLVAGRYVVVLAAWLPEADPARGDPVRWCPPRRCPHPGGTALRAADMVPLSGWRRVRGRCPGCAARIGAWRVPAEILTAAVLAVLALRLGASPALPAFCYLGVAGVALAFIDARHKRLPDPLTLPSYPVALVLLGIAAPAAPDGGRHFLTGLAGLAAAWLLFVIQALVYPAGIGWGDVKLSGLLGLYLGWLGISTLVAGLVLAYLLAAVAGLALLAARRATRKTQVPFGPFLLAGALAAILLSGLGQPVLML
ncbi:MAG TPA: A24 family peptidase [Streptosporangiaceae bacterium]|nr:A24 family peptidase [Streptosporangiaceae bacterium]